MKKKIVSAGLILSLLISGVSVFAQDDLVVMPINEGTSDRAEKDSKIKFEQKTLEEDMTVEESVLLYDNEGNEISAEALKEGSTVGIFTEDEKILAVILFNSDAGSADLDVYKVSDSFGDLINEKNNLALHISDKIEIIDENGEAFPADELAGRKLLVFSNMMTMSIPAQTNPTKIVVLNDEEENEDKKETVAYTVDAEKVRKDEEVTMLPLREVSEGIGLEVGWSEELQKITVGTVPMGVNFVLGENQYNKSRMTPFTLEKAPEMVIFGDYGVTYVPASFFTEILWAEVSENEDGSVTVTASEF